MKVSFAGRADLKIPRRSSTLGANVNWVSEGNPLVVKNFALDGVQLFPYRLGAIAVISRTVATTTSGEAVVTAMLAEDFANKLDNVVFGSAAASAGLNPAGLLNGVTPLTATTGANQEAMLRDLERLAGVVADAGGGEVVYIAATRQAMAVKMRLPMTDITIWPSAALSSGTIIALEPRAFVSAIEPQPIFDSSADTALHMEDTSPAQLATGTGPTVATPIRSLYQTDTLAVRAMIDISFAMRAANMVAVVNNATWGAP